MTAAADARDKRWIALAAVLDYSPIRADPPTCRWRSRSSSPPAIERTKGALAVAEVS